MVNFKFQMVNRGLISYKNTFDFNNKQRVFDEL